MDDILKHETLTNPENIWMQPDSERKALLMKVCGNIVHEYVHFSFNESASLGKDNQYNYAQEILSLGCFYLEFCDAIREGGGHRVLRCWKYLLSVFHSPGRTNYSIEALNMLFQHTITLSSRLCHELLYTCFINVHGIELEKHTR